MTSTYESFFSCWCAMDMASNKQQLDRAYEKAKDKGWGYDLRDWYYKCLNSFPSW